LRAGAYQRVLARLQYFQDHDSVSAAGLFTQVNVYEMYAFWGYEGLSISGGNYLGEAVSDRRLQPSSTQKRAVCRWMSGQLP
jgi:hypothetical protein